jgi:subtilase family serine protease
VTRARIRLFLEELECRALLSASAAPMLGPTPPHGSLHAVKDVPPAHQAAQALPANHHQTAAGHSSSGSSSLNPAWLTPNQIRQAYGFNQVPAFAADYNNTAGKGQTIAIVDVYDDPNILSDANTFSSQFGLPSFNTGQANSPTFIKLNEGGQDITSPLSPSSRPQTNTSWSSEISLDVEWAHAIAPQANIVLIEANSESTSDVFKAMAVAQNYGPVTDSSGQQDPVSVVSMSWGYNESNLPGISADDAKYLTPTTHPLTFVAATLDNGSRYGVFWPAISPNVVGVGGTVLTLNNGGYGSETGWAYSTGGISKYEAQPSYQHGVVTQSTTMRANPDVSYAATNFAAYDTVGTYHGWFQAGGTSAGTPQWAGLIALADQEREAANLSLQPLSSTQTLDALYSFAAQDPSYFHDITSGSNGAYRAGPGYDLVTGIGTPVANQLIPALANYSGS